MTLSPLRILVLDDDVAALRATTRALAPHEVTAVTTASDAFLLLATERFDAILCDVQMPGMSGTEFVRRLSPMDRDLVIFMTGGDFDPQDLVAARHGTLHKPFTRGELAHAIEEVADDVA